MSSSQSACATNGRSAAARPEPALQFRAELLPTAQPETPKTPAELQRLAGPDSLIGLPTYTHDGVQYSREWGTEQGQTELVPMTEHVVNPDESYTITHHAMLYARDTGLTDRRELLLFSVEQDEEGTVSLSTSLGISLYTTDLSTI